MKRCIGAICVVVVGAFLLSCTNPDGPPTELPWTERVVPGDMSPSAWTGIASSADGTKLAAVVRYGLIYTSTDSGANWTECASAGERLWRCVASSDDGSKLAAAVSQGYIYTSTDSGASWTEHASAGARNWYSIASTADGAKLAAAVAGGYIYTSADGGASWTARASEGSWQDITISAYDGT